MKSERVGMIFLARKMSLNAVGLPSCIDGMDAKNLKSERTKKTANFMIRTVSTGHWNYEGIHATIRAMILLDC